MYEPYLTAFRNGVADIDVDINEESFWNIDEDTISKDELAFNNAAATVTVEFAVFTDGIAWITIDVDGLVYPAFGGTGTSQHELDEYAAQAVEIWRAITGDTDTTCLYAVADVDDRDQSDPDLVIDA